MIGWRLTIQRYTSPSGWFGRGSFSIIAPLLEVRCGREWRSRYPFEAGVGQRSILKTYGFR